MADRKPNSSIIDWEDVKRRLSMAKENLATLDELTSEQAKAVMDERARKLAVRPDESESAEATREYVMFRLSQEKFALETRYVLEVRRPNSIADVPAGPVYLVGLTNHYGDVLGVLDLRPKFGQQTEEPLDERNSMCVIGEDRPEFGLLVEEICDVISLDSGRILPPPESLPISCMNLIAGVTADALLVIDGHALLTDDSLLMNEVD